MQNFVSKILQHLLAVSMTVKIAKIVQFVLPSGKRGIVEVGTQVDQILPNFGKNAA